MSYHLILPSIEFVDLSMMFLREAALKDLLLSSCSCLKKRQGMLIVLIIDQETIAWKCLI